MAQKYNVGDKVRIKSIDWYNENKDEDGIVELSTHIFTPGMSQFCGKVVTIEDVFEDIDDNVVYYIEEIDYDWTDEMIEGFVEEKVSLKLTGKAIKNNEMVVSVSEYILPEGYIIKDGNGNVINTNKIVLEKKKEYPKTYEECCRVLGVSEFEYNHTGTNVWYRHKLMATLDKLMLCRDAYWKLYGEEMGLGKPWEPDYNDLNNTMYGLYDELKYSILNPSQFVFPTPEMRDAFKEYFDTDIKSCKELL